MSALFKCRDGALQVASDDRTVLEPVVMVIAGVIPVSLIARERKAIYSSKGGNLREVVAREERQRTFTEWLDSASHRQFRSMAEPNAL